MLRVGVDGQRLRLQGGTVVCNVASHRLIVLDTARIIICSRLFKKAGGDDEVATENGESELGSFVWRDGNVGGIACNEGKAGVQKTNRLTRLPIRTCKNAYIIRIFSKPF